MLSKSWASPEMIAAKMNEAAEQASQEWLQKAQARGPAYAVKSGERIVGTLLDVCGFGALLWRDKRSAAYRAFKKAGLNSYSNRGPEVRYSLRCRQEMGLHEAAMRAAAEVAEQNGLPVRVWTYID